MGVTRGRLFDLLILMLIGCILGWIILEVSPKNQSIQKGQVYAKCIHTSRPCLFYTILSVDGNNVSYEIQQGGLSTSSVFIMSIDKFKGLELVK